MTASVFILFSGAHVSAASYNADVDTRVAASFSTVASISVTGRLALVAAEHSRQQRAVLHPLRGEPGPVRVRARTEGHLQQVRHPRASSCRTLVQRGGRNRTVARSAISIFSTFSTGILISNRGPARARLPPPITFPRTIGELFLRATGILGQDNPRSSKCARMAIGQSQASNFSIPISNALRSPSSPVWIR